MKSKEIIKHMGKELSGCTRCPKFIIAGCYDASVNHYGFQKGNKEEIVNTVYNILTKGRK